MSHCHFSIKNVHVFHVRRQMSTLTHHVHRRCPRPSIRHLSSPRHQPPSSPHPPPPPPHRLLRLQTSWTYPPTPNSTK